MKLLLINMPFAALRPSLGLSLLKAEVETIGVKADVAYCNLEYAASVGYRQYQFLSQGAPPQLLVGEWIFAEEFTSITAGKTQSTDADGFIHFIGHHYPRLQSEWVRQTVTRARSLARGFLSDCIKELPYSNYEIIGFSTTFAQNMSSLALASLLKQKYPNKILLFGGANCEGEMGLQLHRSYPFIDFVATGEADCTLPALLQCLRKGEDPSLIPGVVSRCEGSSRYIDLKPIRPANLSRLPYPDFSDYFKWQGKVADNWSESALAAAEVEIPFETSRGCWWGEKHHCTFCGLNGLGMAYRYKDPDRALSEIRYLLSRHKVRRFSAVDNIISMTYFRTFLASLATADLGIELFYETKANLKKEQVQLLAQAGVRTIQPGIESFSSHVLQLMDKGTSALQNVQLLKWCQEFAVTPVYNILEGFPGETADDYEQMTTIISAIHHLRPPSGGKIIPVRVDRFSPMFDRSSDLGIGELRPAEAYRHVYALPERDVRNLAYYFDHNSVGCDRELEAARQRARAEVAIWQRDAEHNSLVSFRQNDSLFLLDARGGTGARLHVLDGWQRDAYAACDAQKSLEALAATIDAEVSALTSFVRSMVDERLMIQDRNRVLSVAVNA